MLFFLDNLLISQESVSLQCVFIVLDLRLTKVGQGVAPFYAYTLRPYLI